MNAETAAELRRRIEGDPDADLSTLATETDTSLAIGRDVWRLRWRNQITTAVAEDANLHITCVDWVLAQMYWWGCVQSGRSNW